MALEPGADERRIRSLLRRRGVGPDATPQPAPHPDAGERSPDWLDRLYADDQQPGEQPRWYTAAKDHTPTPPTAAPAAPGVQVTITPTPTTSPVSPRRARIRWWTLRRGTAAAAGWYLGLGPTVQHQLADAGTGAVGYALLLWLVAWVAASKALRLIPGAASREVHDAADWAAHIPSATVLLALALNTPGVVQ